MANWKKVDVDQLDADLTSVADAIRERSGTAEALNFPDGFVSAVEGIQDYVVEYCAGNLTSYRNDKLTIINGQMFRGHQNTLHYYFPNVTTVSDWSFAQSKIQTIILPKATDIYWDNFRDCANLTTADFGAAKYIQTRVFLSAKSFETLILRRTDTVTALYAIDALSGTKIEGGTGYIYVPRSLVDSYKAATNWSTYANQFRAIEDYPEITGGAV